ncbi:Mg2+ transporter [Ligilactobacillus hayakitensis DSM 18933 = JCM 14209]|uniref:Magnesium transporter MgtE n=1 Tax=Ligilactobacillus hayakitensis DSM 18933 = JCM 14209 TaxID=1423755 RepID=A0A0R1WMX9_9LACO|nr:magnesium transporter [Ligilactobacillus hayakitensis]KRM19223.1 Mg2+ transporter [Ligilactobacillus hayakitensis DSM 18933 = JCM 14209]
MSTEIQNELEKMRVKIIANLDEQKAHDFRIAFLDLHVYEQAQIFADLNVAQRARVYRYLTPDEVGEIFNVSEEEPALLAGYFEEMTPRYAAQVINSMYTDNAVDILAFAKKKNLAKYLKLIPSEDASEIREMLHYEDKTAGAIMSTEYVDIVGNQTVRSAMHIIKSEALEAETIYYIYVIDDEEKLVGVLTLRDLLTNDDDIMISDIMNTPVMSVQVTEDQEEVAQTIKDYNFLALPVTDYDDKLIGIINVDDIIDVIDEESTEDFSGLAGVDTEQGTDNPFMNAWTRFRSSALPLFLGFITILLVEHYENLINKATILAVFISMITGAAGNAGTQSLAVAVKRIANNDDQETSWFSTILNETLTGVIVGFCSGLIIWGIVGVWKANFVLGFVIGVAMLCAITFANLVGCVIPMLMDKVNLNPSIASGPFISTLSDVTSLLIYFSFASMFLKFFIGQ